MPDNATIRLFPTHLRVQASDTVQDIAEQLAGEALELQSIGGKAVALPICSEELTRGALLRAAVDALERHKVDGLACTCASCNEVRRLAARLEEEAPASAGEPEDPPEEDLCAHDWIYTGTAYGGDDERWHGEGRAYCSKCGADGDA